MDRHAQMIAPKYEARIETRDGDLYSSEDCYVTDVYVRLTDYRKRVSFGGAVREVRQDDKFIRIPWWNIKQMIEREVKT